MPKVNKTIKLAKRKTAPARKPTRLPNAPARLSTGVFVATIMTRCKLCEVFVGHTMLKVKRSAFGRDPHHVLRCMACGRERRVETVAEAITVDMKPVVGGLS